MFANMARCTLGCLIAGLCFSSFVRVSAQSPSPTPTPSPSFTLSIGNTTLTSTSIGGGQTVNITTIVPTTYNLSVSATSTSSSTASSTATPTITLDTKIDPAFGVLGALLILTGIPSTFLGHRNRWTSFFLIGFYTLALVCFVLILQFGILQAIHPPSKTLRGLFVLSCVVAGSAGGAIAIFFWKVTRYFIGGWGGLVLGLFVQCMRNGGLIGPISYRWIMYIGCGVVGFCLCTVPKIHYHVVLIATALVGSTSFMLGVDCFSAADLKEFYMWNLGFKDLFPKYTDNNIRFPVTQTMQIELGLMGAVALMGIAVQLRILKVLQRKLLEIAVEQKRQHDEAEAKAAEQLVNLDQEKQEWEKQHGRELSDLSSTELQKGRNSSSTRHPSTDHTVVGTRSRYQSGTPDFLATPNPRSQSPGPIPVLDLGVDIQGNVPRDFIAGASDSRKPELSPVVTDDLAHKEALLTEIQNIRRSIEVLKSEPSPTTSYSRRPSVTSRRTLSQDLNSIAQYRTNSQSDARSRVQSTEISGMARDLSGSSITRPTSVPLPDDWDSYVRDRKLLQPPSGVSAPIPTSSLLPTHRLSMSSAVLEAMAQRQKLESLLVLGGFSRAPSDDDSPLAMDASPGDPPVRRSSHLRTKSAGNIPVAILPPRKNVLSPAPEKLSTPTPRIATYEELSERHREKMREIQSPLTQTEKQYAELSAAKERWERSKAFEKQAVTRRQSQEAAAVMKEDRKRKSEDLDTRADRRSRTQSMDRLVATGGQSSKRMSTMKVEDWKKHQEEFDVETPRSTRVARQPEISAVPFPNARRISNVPRQPPH